MSGAISGAGFPVLGRLIDGMTRVKQNFDTLTQQASSGMISDTYAGLGGTAPVALALGPRIDNLRAAQNNIAAASGPAQVIQLAMTQIGSIAANLAAEMPTLGGLNPTEIDVIAANARSALAQMGDLLNSQYNGAYVFAGQDSANPPVPNPDQIATSNFFKQISAAVGGLAGNGAAATIATTLTIGGSNAAGTSPFSAYLSQPTTALSPPSVATGDGRSQTIGLLASGNTSSVSLGGSTTGSYMRDLMRALATVGSMSSGQANNPNFALLVSDTQTSVKGAITAMATDVGILGEQQSNLTNLSVTLGDTATVLSTQLSTAQEVDMASTLSNLSFMQTQLQESYQLIAAENGLSLAKYLA
jgi:flagellar hook-associated protein 3 FlgL